ncbi:PaaX family transcriptional regulator [Pararhizobium sp. BT-229]|uniref:PaaX family transcriptional regulator C-terminal domain-containing protein n=1 Tax=Pararhizobium sp. BT-229 TaxID=2986923 RepID=UPI0021F6C299|nr:PaaX family transcriptional regulator C-terminal domain-containing protein [Pararhizobium sp. BT-229]MCV9967250.1 PaaX family transcriptional regulator [Pararhizobium sp. BT-229]
MSNASLRAASFIVTIYGDVVEPRGGAIWIGNLIETCAEVGISETLVRTAVSRLMAAGQLAGEREGRRSYYRLTAAAQTDFAAAARLLFGPPEQPLWRFVYLGGTAFETDARALEQAGYSRLGSRLSIGSRPLPQLSGGAVVFNAEVAGGGSGLKELAAEYWDLSNYAEAYREFLQRFGAFSEALARGEKLGPIEHLAARLVLVHQYRMIVLHDPRLPAVALPGDWPQAEVRRLFADLYIRLSRKADDFIAHRFLTADGPLPAQTGATRHRIDELLAIM